MNLPDTNVWLALALSKHALHAVVRDWFAAQSGRLGSVLFCRANQHSLLRLLTTDKLMRLYDLPPLDNSSAWRFYERFLADSRIAWIDEPPGIEIAWRRFADRKTASPKLWMDAYLAAFALTSGHRLITTDGAFTQFKKLEAEILSKS